MKKENEIIAHNIKMLREHSNETQAEFGERLGSNQKNMWSYEKGFSHPKLSFLNELSKASGIPTSTLLTVKLKMGKDGRITNLPAMDKKYMAMHKQMNDLIESYRATTEKFLHDIDSLYANMGAHLKE